MFRRTIVSLIVVPWIFAGLVGCDAKGLLNHKKPKAVVPPPVAEYADYMWLADRLAHRRQVTTDMLTSRFGEPKSTQEYAVGSDRCWYFECVNKEGLPVKIQVVISRKETVRRARLY